MLTATHRASCNFLCFWSGRRACVAWKLAVCPCQSVKKSWVADRRGKAPTQTNLEYCIRYAVVGTIAHIYRTSPVVSSCILYFCQQHEEQAIAGQPLSRQRPPMSKHPSSGLDRSWVPKFSIFYHLSNEPPRPHLLLSLYFLPFIVSLFLISEHFHPSTPLFTRSARASSLFSVFPFAFKLITFL